MSVFSDTILEFYTLFCFHSYRSALRATSPSDLHRSLSLSLSGEDERHVFVDKKLLKQIKWGDEMPGTQTIGGHLGLMWSESAHSGQRISGKSRIYSFSLTDA